MKSIQNWGVVLVMLLGATIFTYGQQTHVITLSVDTNEINDENVLEVCSLQASENTTVEADDDLESFTVIVNEGDDIIWEGVSDFSEDHIVEITKVKYDSGTEVFNDFKTKDLEGKKDGKKKKVKAKVKNNTKNKEPTKYILKFTVIVNGVESEEYSIDPVIKVQG